MSGLWYARFWNLNSATRKRVQRFCLGVANPNFPKAKHTEEGGGGGGGGVGVAGKWHVLPKKIYI